MISKAEQQEIMKMPPGDELSAQVTKWVVPNKKIGPFLKSKLPVHYHSYLGEDGMPIKDIPFAFEYHATLILAELLGEPIHIVKIKNSDWELTLGATTAKKIVTVKHQNLATALSKALIIYVRKFL